MKTIQQTLTHNKLDAHLRYACINDTCRIDHWLTLQEAMTKNFKIVCDCGAIYKPKRIRSVKIQYSKPKSRPSTTSSNATNQVKEISHELLNQATEVLINYGFTSTEAESLVRSAYDKQPTNDVGLLIKLSLSIFGGSNG